jgi:hypothetical protein
LLRRHDPTAEFLGRPAVVAREATAALTGETHDDGQRTLASHPGDEPVPDAAHTIACLTPPRREGWIGSLGKYDLKAVLGRAGMGTVIRGADPNLARPVAIKVLTSALAVHPSAPAARHLVAAPSMSCCGP